MSNNKPTSKVSPENWGQLFGMIEQEGIFGIMDKWLETKRGQRYNEIIDEYDKMDTDESWEDFISRQPIPNEEKEVK